MVNKVPHCCSHMKKSAILLLLLLSVNLFAQDKNDSLLNLLESVSDSERIRVLKELCWENRYTDPLEALDYGLQALTLVRQYEDYQQEASIQNYLGIIQRNVGDNATALEYFFKAQRVAEEQQNITDLAYALNNIGDIYNMEGNYRKALEYELKALGIFEETGDSLGVSYCCHQIALGYTNLEAYTRALEYDTRAMNIRESLGNRAGVAYSLINIGQTYLKLGRSGESLESLEKSRDIFTELGDGFGLSFAWHNLGMFFRATGNREEAIAFFTRAMDLGSETGSPIRVRNAAQELSELYAEQGKYREAYQMHLLYKETYDSLYREENLVKITQLVMQNEYEQRELKQLARLARQKQFRNYLMLSFALVVILVIVILNRNHIKRKAIVNLQKKNAEIESQKDHLLLLNDQLERQKSELNNTLQELTKAQTHLVQSEKMASLGQVTAGVAHELNNPLNFIIASVKPLQRNMEDLVTLLGKYDSAFKEHQPSGELDEVEAFKAAVDYNFLVQETMDLLKGINEGASRSGHIVKELRTFSRMDENEFKFIDIHEGIESTLLLLRNKVQDRIMIHKNYGKIDPVECLPGKLNQVFMNILTNSILAIEGKGDIFIETGRQGENARISIRDTGRGMAPGIIAHIFEPFFTTRPVGKGTGLGLSISYSIIEEHHGKIEVLSVPGEGSEFVILIPFRRTDG